MIKLEKKIKLSDLLGDRIYKMKEKRSRRRKIAQREFDNVGELMDNNAKMLARSGVSSNKE